NRVVTVVETDVVGVDTKPLEIVPAEASTQQRTTLATGPIAFAGATLARLVARRARAQGDDAVVVPKSPPASMGAVVLAEENKIRQVLTNLMGNALRFTPAGTPIEIGVGVDQHAGLALLSVIDHGPGIPAQIRGKIFQ